MGGKAGALITAAVVGVVTGGTGVAFFGTTLIGPGFAAGLAGFVGSFALSTLQTALAPKPKSGGEISFAQTAQETTQTFRQAITAHRFIYGERRVGGALTFYEATDNKKYHHMVVTVAAHEVDGFGTVWLNDTPVFRDQLDAGGNCIAGPYSGKLRIKFLTGADDQAADADLVAETSATANHRWRRRASVYLRIQWDRDTWPNGLPDPSFWVRGKKVEDPRVSGPAAWHNNPVLCTRDWLLTTKIRGGLGAALSEIDETLAISSANSCEEIVDTLDVPMIISAVDQSSPSTDTISLTGAKLLFQRGDRVRYDTTGGAITGLTDSGLYYIIPHQERSTDDEAVKVKLAATYDDAITATAISLQSAGGGDQTLTKTGEPRYTCSGTIDTSRKRKLVFGELLASMAGWYTYASGEFKLYAGVYTAPTVTLSEEHVIRPFITRTKVSGRERVNLVHGVYSSPLEDNQPTDYPAATSAAYEAADLGEPTALNLDLPFTSRAGMAQRIAGITLAEARLEKSVETVFHLAASQMHAGETVAITNAVRSWSAKPFRFEEIGLVNVGSGAAPALGIQARIRETAAAAYDWTASTDEKEQQAAVIPIKASALNVAAPTGLALSSGTAELDARLDGTIFSRIKATWTAPADEFVIQGGKIELAYRKTAGSPEEDWIRVSPLEGDAIEFYILDVQDGVAHDVAVRSINRLGVRSDKSADPSTWSALVTGHLVAGKTVLPADVASLTAQQNGNVVTFKWPAITDIDRDGYEIRFMVAPFSWDSGKLVTEETKGTLVTNAALPPGAWVVGIKAIDTTGNYSANATTTAITITNQNTVVAGGSDEATRWTGTKTNCHKHEVSGRLVPTSISADSTADGTFASAYPSPPASWSYEGAIIDLGFDANDVRMWADMTAVIGPGETGAADPILDVDYRDDAASFDGYEEAITPLTVDGRHLKYRMRIEQATGEAALSLFKPNADVSVRTEVGTDLVVAGGGTAVLFTTQFHSAPNIQLTADEGASSPTEPLFPMKSAVATTGFTARVFDKAGNDVGGTVDWQATGV